MQPLLITADLSKESDTEYVVKTVIENYGKLDVLVSEQILSAAYC